MNREAVKTLAADPLPVRIEGQDAGSRFRVDIQRAKGLAIFLVVLGHLVTGAPPGGNQWYMHLRAGIYAFHMPFFMALSGFVFFYANSLAKGLARPGRWVGQRAKRLLLPFLIFGLVIVLGKHAVATFAHVDNISGNLLTDIVNIVWLTPQSAAKSIWYVFVLFQINLLVLSVGRFIRSPLLLFLLTAPLAPISFQFTVLYLDRLFLYMPFFFLGGLLAVRGQPWLDWIDRNRVVSVIAFAVALAITRVAGIWLLSLYLCGIASIPALLGIVRSHLFAQDAILMKLGELSFAIYLLNTIFIGVAKAVMLPFVPWGGPAFLVYFVVLLTAGMLGPIFVKRYIFSRIRFLDEMTS